MAQDCSILYWPEPSSNEFAISPTELKRELEEFHLKLCSPTTNIYEEKEPVKSVALNSCLGEKFFLHVPESSLTLEVREIRPEVKQKSRSLTEIQKSMDQTRHKLAIIKKAEDQKPKPNSVESKLQRHEALLAYKKYFGPVISLSFIVPCDDRFPVHSWNQSLGANVYDHVRRGLNKGLKGSIVEAQELGIKIGPSKRHDQEKRSKLVLHCFEGVCSFFRENGHLKMADGYTIPTADGEHRIKLSVWWKTVYLRIRADKWCLSRTDCIDKITCIMTAIDLHWKYDPNKATKEFVIAKCELYPKECWGLRLGYYLLIPIKIMHRIAEELLYNTPSKMTSSLVDLPSPSLIVPFNMASTLECLSPATIPEDEGEDEMDLGYFRDG